MDNDQPEKSTYKSILLDERQERLKADAGIVFYIIPKTEVNEQKGKNNDAI